MSKGREFQIVGAANMRPH